jgi:hypothetical protein
MKEVVSNYCNILVYLPSILARNNEQETTSENDLSFDIIDDLDLWSVVCRDGGTSIW